MFVMGNARREAEGNGESSAEPRSNFLMSETASLGGSTNMLNSSAASSGSIFGKNLRCETVLLLLTFVATAATTPQNSSADLMLCHFAEFEGASEQS
jgi:hypothetical protein